MPTFVPSQIREFLDARLPAALNQLRTGQPFDIVGLEYAGALVHLVFMLDGVPEHLLTLRGADAADFGEALQAIRVATDAWRAGNVSFPLRALTGRNGWHPISIVRKHLDFLPDEGPGRSQDALIFLGDDALRAVLEADLGALEDDMDRGAWKSATILGGAVVEALLLSSLLPRESEAKTAAASVKPKPPPDLNEWHLHHLTEVAAAMQVISTTTAAQCRIAKDFRNLIHPGRMVRLSQVCDRGTAHAVAAAVEFVIRDLRKAR
jgi:hypothetical protein